MLWLFIRFINCFFIFDGDFVGDDVLDFIGDVMGVFLGDFLLGEVFEGFVFISDGGGKLVYEEVFGVFKVFCVIDL